MSSNPEDPAKIRRYRSMLEVEDPPTIQPVEPLSFEELYTNKPDQRQASKPKPPENQATEELKNDMSQDLPLLLASIITSL